LTTLVLLMLVQFLHVLGAIIFVGGNVFFAAVVWPDLLRRPAAEGKAAFAAFEKPVGLLMASAGHLLLWLGLLRGTYFGPIQSVDTLIHTGYGHTWLTALVLFIILMGYGGSQRARLTQRIWDGDRVRPDARAYLRRYHTITFVLLGLILACMIMMRFGL
jgi:putative copper resistance protein D